MTHRPYGGLDMAMTQKEVADALGMPANTVHTIEKRAMEKLRAILQKKNLKMADLLPETETA